MLLSRQGWLAEIQRNGGGFSVEADDRAGLERLLLYCARPPFALERLEAIDALPLPAGKGSPLTHPPGKRTLRWLQDRYQNARCSLLFRLVGVQISETRDQ